eukprot:32004_2
MHWEDWDETEETDEASESGEGGACSESRVGVLLRDEACVPDEEGVGEWQDAAAVSVGVFAFVFAWAVGDGWLLC